VFCEGLGLELEGTGVQIQALCPGFTRTEFHDRAGIDKSKIPRILWLSADRVVDDSLAQLAAKGPVVCVPTRRYKLVVLMLRFMPAWMLRPFRAKYGKART
jgi:hypothetical protein